MNSLYIAFLVLGLAVAHTEAENESVILHLEPISADLARIKGYLISRYLKLFFLTVKNGKFSEITLSLEHRDMFATLVTEFGYVLEISVRTEVRIADPNSVSCTITGERLTIGDIVEKCRIHDEYIILAVPYIAAGMYNEQALKFWIEHTDSALDSLEVEGQLVPPWNSYKEEASKEEGTNGFFALSSSASSDLCMGYGECELCTLDATCGWCNMTTAFNIGGNETYQMCITAADSDDYNCTALATDLPQCPDYSSSASDSEFSETITIAELSFTLSALFFALMSLCILLFSCCGVGFLLLVRSRLEILKPINARWSELR